MKQLIKVLLIEDNTKDVLLIKEMLAQSSSFSFEIHTVDSLYEFQKIDGQEYDIVLLDMRFVSGVESYKLAYTNFPRTPIIVVTCLSDEKLAYDVVKLGAQDYILKDNIDTKGLIRSIRYAIERKKAELHKDDFLGFASHELKTPVTSIKAYVQLMDMYTATGKKNSGAALSPIIKKIDTQVDKLTQIINDLLDVTKVQAGKMEYNYENFFVETIVDEVIDMMQLTTSRHKIIKRGKSNANVYGDKERTAQVLVNLLSNAIKYSPDADKIFVTIADDYGTVSIAVQDFGMGIAKKNQKKVFDRFYRVDGKYKETYPGLGLGLFIASEIIKRQNGTLTVNSEEGKGSTFKIELSAVRKLLKPHYEKQHEV